jgi:hypothetical protein
MKRMSSTGVTARTWRWITPTGAALILLLALTAPAHAQRDDYCGVAVNAGTWCGNNSVWHTYYANESDANAAPGGVCERMIGHAGGIRGTGPHCGSYNASFFTWCYTGVGQTSVTWNAEAQQNYIYGRATLSGHAWFGTGSPSYGC